MIKSVTTESQQYYDGLTLAAEITVLGGSTRQIYNVGTQTYEDDRELVPCILYADMDGKDPSARNSNIGLNGIEWYTSPPKENDYSTGRITNPSTVPTNPSQYRKIDYLISDGSSSPWCAGVPAGALIVHKNVEARTSMPIYAVIKSTDPRFNTEIRIVRSENFVTEAFDDSTVAIEGTWGSQVVFDPLAVSESGTDVLAQPWLRSVGVHLNGPEGVVPVASSCFQWMIADETVASGFRKFTELEKETLGISNDKAAELSIDIRMLQGEMTMRCYGCRLAEDDVWTDPLQTPSPFYETTVAVKLSSAISATPECLGGADQGYNMSEQSKWSMRYVYANKQVPDNKKSFFINYWKGQNIRTRAKFSLPPGPSLSFRPRDYNITYADGYTVGADVAVYDNCKPVEDANHTIVVDDTTGAMVISPTFV